jgi:hypothetical protein
MSVFCSIVKRCDVNFLKSSPLKTSGFVSRVPVDMRAIVRRYCSRKQDAFAIPTSRRPFLRLSPVAILRMRGSFLTRPSYHGAIVLGTRKDGSDGRKAPIFESHWPNGRIDPKRNLHAACFEAHTIAGHGEIAQFISNRALCVQESFTRRPCAVAMRRPLNQIIPIGLSLFGAGRPADKPTIFHLATILMPAPNLSNASTKI